MVYHVMKTSETEIVNKYVSCYSKQERVSLLHVLDHHQLNPELLESMVDQLEENK